MRKIILVSNTSWYLYNFRLSVIKLFLSKNFEVICIANIDDYSEKLIENGTVFIKSDLANKGTNPFNDYAYYKFLYDTYIKVKPAFIFHYTIKPNIYGSMAAHKAGIPSIAVVSGAGYVFLHDNFLTKLTKKLYTKAAKNCSEMWFVNKEDQSMFQQQKIVSPSKTKVLPGEGINTELFKRDNPYPANNEIFTFLLGGRMLWDKGVGIYVEAARLIKEKYACVKFQLLGFIDELNPSSIPKEQITTWVDEGIIEYLGVTDNVKFFLNRINCFVLPSFYKEGVPKSLLEAASMEIPLITTDNIGCREVVEDGYNGFLCAVKDSKSLADKMEQIICMQKQDLINMGIKGREKAIKSFHESLVLDYYTTTINKYIQAPACHKSDNTIAN
jgi:glycosyltransferase involved in cell wall biosynthesis